VVRVSIAGGWQSGRSPVLLWQSRWGQERRWKIENERRRTSLFCFFSLLWDEPDGFPPKKLRISDGIGPNLNTGIDEFDGWRGTGWSDVGGFLGGRAE
jgi:hypothetical protein